jgi:hypothetical protein
MYFVLVVGACNFVRWMLCAAASLVSARALRRSAIRNVAMHTARQIQ